MLPDYAIIADLDLRTQPLLELGDRQHIRQLQLDDVEAGALLRRLETTKRHISDRGAPFVSALLNKVVYSTDLFGNETLRLVAMPPGCRHRPFRP